MQMKRRCSKRRMQESGLPVINEVLFLSNPSSPNFSERRKFIEIYRPDTSFLLSGCALENDSGSFQVVFDKDVGSVKSQYFTVKHKATLGREFVMWERQGILWMRDMDLNEIDGLGLFCADKMIDFLAWGRDGLGPNGDVYNEAVDVAMWSSDDDYVETGVPDGPFPFPQQAALFIGKKLKKGDSLGRDKMSTDTNGLSDWSYPGGNDARGPTPGSQNFEYTGLPLINEVLYLPDPKSRDFAKRRSFVEIYRHDTSYSLSGCSLMNTDGRFRVDFDEIYGLCRQRVLCHQAQVYNQERIFIVGKQRYTLDA